MKTKTSTNQEKNTKSNDTVSLYKYTQKKATQNDTRNTPGKSTSSEQEPPSPGQLAYVRSIKRNKNMIRLLQLFILIAFLSLWEVAAHYNWINDFIFCSPSKLYSTFLDMMKDGSLPHHIGITLYETLVGFAIVTFGSLLVAILFWWNTTLSKVFEPYLVMLNALPKSALAPVLIVWLGANQTTIIVCACSVAIFGSILNIYTGFASLDNDKLKLIETLKGNRFHCLRMVVLPSNVPNILSIMKVNIGLCLVGVVIGEFLAAKEGLGYLIIYGSQTFKMSNVLLSILILCAIAMLLYMILQRIERKLSEYF